MNKAHCSEVSLSGLSPADVQILLTGFVASFNETYSLFSSNRFNLDPQFFYGALELGELLSLAKH